MNNKKKKDDKQGRSMFLYTALIFAVALILIILAFFGQTNLSNLRQNTSLLTPTESPIPASEENIIYTERPNTDEELAKMANLSSTLEAENKELKDELDIYEKLLSANGYLSAGNSEEAKKIIDDIDESKLTNDQLILYNNINEQIIKEG